MQHKKLWIVGLGIEPSCLMALLMVTTVCRMSSNTSSRQIQAYKVGQQTDKTP